MKAHSTRWFTAALLAMALGGCKQDVGERCQLDSDCKDGLICNQGTMECQPRGGGGGVDASPADAPVAADAPTSDAPVFDAAADADLSDAEVPEEDAAPDDDGGA